MEQQQQILCVKVGITTCGSVTMHNLQVAIQSEESDLDVWRIVEHLWGVQDIIKRNVKALFFKHRPPYSTFSLAQDYFGKPIHFQTNGWAFQESVSCLPAMCIFFF